MEQICGRLSCTQWLYSKVAHPMPKPRGILDSLHGYKYYFSFNCASTCWQTNVFSLWPHCRPHADTLKWHEWPSDYVIARRPTRDWWTGPFTKSNMQISMDHILVHYTHLYRLVGDTDPPRVSKVQFPADKCRLVYKHTEFVGYLISPCGHSPLLSNL